MLYFRNILILNHNHSFFDQDTTYLIRMTTTTTTPVLRENFELINTVEAIYTGGNALLSEGSNPTLFCTCGETINQVDTTSGDVIAKFQVLSGPVSGTGFPYQVLPAHNIISIYPAISLFEKFKKTSYFLLTIMCFCFRNLRRGVSQELHDPLLTIRRHALITPSSLC